MNITDRFIDDLELPVGIQTALEANGVETISQLVACSRGQLASFGVGPKGIETVEEHLDNFGLSLRPGDESAPLKHAPVPNSDTYDTILAIAEDFIGDDDLESAKRKLDAVGTSAYPLLARAVSEGWLAAIDLSKALGL